jgi:hypothetical protein
MRTLPSTRFFAASEPSNKGLAAKAVRRSLKMAGTSHSFLGKAGKGGQVKGTDLFSLPFTKNKSVPFFSPFSLSKTTQRGEQVLK